jgi:hypothetical protein
MGSSDSTSAVQPGLPGLPVPREAVRRARSSHRRLVRGPTESVLETVQAAIHTSLAKEDEALPYVLRPSSLARGCALLIAFEAAGFPKLEIDSDVVLRILDVGTDSHRRLQRYLGPVLLAREVPLRIPEYALRGFVDGLIYLSDEQAPAAAGFYCAELKTMSDDELDLHRQTGRPRDDHLRQLGIYLWGVERCYPAIRPRGGIILYEARGSLRHQLFYVERDDAPILAFLDRARQAAELAHGGVMTTDPLDRLPLEDWGHRYCPYRELCADGKLALEWQRTQPQPLRVSLLAEKAARAARLRLSASQETRPSLPALPPLPPAALLPLGRRPPVADLAPFSGSTGIAPGSARARGRRILDVLGSHQLDFEKPNPRGSGPP